MAVNFLPRFWSLGLLVLIVMLKRSEANFKCSSEEYRPRYHFSPKANWINDPNGMIQYKGVYHLFYQYHPESSVWGPMSWGHAVSRDMIIWEERDIAISPDENGFIFSGSSVLDNLNTTGFKPENSTEDPIVAIYTSASGENNVIQRQSLAYSLDGGDTFTMYEHNPVLSDPDKPDFRDPKVFAYDGKWTMSLAVQNRIEFFTSNNLKNWTMESEFGNEPQYGIHDGVWECPDMISLNVDISDKLTIELWILLVSINPGGPNQGSATQYFIGNFARNYSDPNSKLTFTSYDWKDSQWLDWGPDNYAGVTFANHPYGKWVYMAWMNNWNYANNLPTTTWRGQMTLPRELSIRVLNYEEKQFRLVSTPIPEIENLRNPFEKHEISEAFTVSPQTIISLTQQMNFKNPLMELQISLNATDNPQFSICASNSREEETCFGFNGTHFYLDRSKSGNIQFNDNFARQLHAYANREIDDEIINIRMFLDVSSLEVFADDGLTTMTALHYASEPFDSFHINHWSKPSSTSKLSVLRYSVYGLHCWFPEEEPQTDPPSTNPTTGSPGTSTTPGGSSAIKSSFLALGLVAVAYLFR